MRVFLKINLLVVQLQHLTVLYALCIYFANCSENQQHTKQNSRLAKKTCVLVNSAAHDLVGSHTKTNTQYFCVLQTYFIVRTRSHCVAHNLYTTHWPSATCSTVTVCYKGLTAFELALRIEILIGTTGCIWYSQVLYCTYCRKQQHT